MRSLSAQGDLNTVPTQFETVDNQNRPTQDLPPDVQPSPPVTKPNSPNAEKPTTTEVHASKIIYYAQKVVDTEAKKLGTACNVFVNRVLTLAGFANENYLANDFDLYAKKNFKTYKAVDFKYDPEGSEENRLKKYLWSYPERTPFIMQWSQQSGSYSTTHGHLALVERIADKLVIYQASLGTQRPHKAQTTVEILLTGYSRRMLTVYSEMIPE